VLNVGGYYDPLIAFIDHACVEGFVRTAQRASLSVSSDPDELLELLMGSAVAD
jgi:predicted Rossmann-fold nucleotide-binding protein